MINYFFFLERDQIQNTGCWILNGFGFKLPDFAKWIQFKNEESKFNYYII